MLTNPSYTKKAVDFMRRTRLLKQYKEVGWEQKKVMRCNGGLYIACNFNNSG